MPRKPFTKPGPKVSKPSKNIKSFLGEDEYDSDDDNFHSPEIGEQTDYGLEYTTTSPRRISRANLPAASSITQDVSDSNSSENNENISPIPQRGRESTASNRATTSRKTQDSLPLSSRRDQTDKSNVPQTSKNVENTPHRTLRTSVREERPGPSNATNRRGKTRKKAYPVKNALQEIRVLQLRTDNLIPRANFARVVRELIMQNCRHDLRVTEMALLGLQEAAEMYMTDFFEDAYLITLHRGRVTLDVKDMQLLRFLKGVKDVCNP